MTIPVLICDDSALARKQMARTLPKEWDVDITYATNGAEGLEAIKAGKGEIVFLDLNMPVMDGYDVLRHIQQQDLPAMVIVVSGDIQIQAHQRVKALGALDFIQKPVSADAITNILEEYGILTLALKNAEPEADNPMIKVDLRDACQEVANVAMGRAADLLSKLLDVFVLLPIPNVNVLEVSELTMALKATEADAKVSALCQGFIGAGIAGEALLLFHDSSFADMAKLMNMNDTTNTEIEVMMDTGNVLIGAFLNGISEQLDMHFSQSHPVVLGRHCTVNDLIHDNSDRWSRTLAMEINYRIEGHNVQCDLLLLFTEDSMPTLEFKLGYLMD
ncbi:response regulator [Shewanella sp. C32]|uniref:Response regulator n=1 Tax=Shewanella electrica TaxID=515560 RepID=A0ABT2FPU3_9GAMM|nr:response regulator [Shewanella electrica]MCH1925685.1 response regulator [Shewanella electrica]MCS4558066.1 response regulator [Shewanella electrica]